MSVTSRFRPLVLSALVLFLGSPARAESSVSRRPSMVIVLPDDQTWSDSGAYGNPEVRTPNIDRLAREGMRFTRAFTATAMCAPTRQQLYTGIFPVRNGAYPNHSRVRKGTRSIVHHLSALGYRVGLCGKRHFGPRESFPFETVGAKSLRAFVERDDDAPYCLVYASNSPHLPWTEGDASAYDAKKLTLPPDLVDTPETRAALVRYYAEITDFDRELGELLAIVDGSRRSDDTIVIYTSEQGAQFPRRKWTCYEGGLHVAFIVRWPATVRAGSVTDAMIQYVDVVPTLLEAAGGKVPEGLDGKSFLRVLRGETETHNDAVFGVHTTRGILYGTPCYPVRSIRTESHRLIWNLNHVETFRNVTIAAKDKGGYWSTWRERAKTDEKARKLVEAYTKRPEFELYDVLEDPFELNNLASEPSRAALKAQLLSRLRAWMKQQGDLGIETELATHENRKTKGQ